MSNSVLTKDFGSAGNRKTMTFSFWAKRNKISAEGDQFIGDLQNAYPSHFIRFDSTDQLDIRSQTAVSGETLRFTTNRKFKDLSSWYHFVIAIDTTQATASNRLKLYVNGVQETSFGTSQQTNGFDQNSDTHFNQGAKTEYIGRYDSSYANFNLAHYHFVDGTALTPATFGETDSTTGEWKAKLNPSVTYGTHGFFLKFENSGALGTDSSGNSKTFTVVGNLKQSNSTPSNTFPTLDDLQIRNANKIFNAGTTQLSYANQTDSVNATQLVKTGKWYWEVKSETDATNESYCIQMYLNGSVSAYNTFTYQSNNSQVGRQTDGTGWTYFPNSTGTGSAPHYIFENSGTNYGVEATANDIVMCAVDLSNATTGKVWFGKNGTWHNAPGTSNVGNPATGANPGISFAKKDDFWGIAISSGDNAANNSTKNTHINFGTGFFGTTAVSSAQADDNNVGIFEYDVPAGFYAICSKNIKDYG